MSSGPSIQPLVNLFILSACAAAVILTGLALLCWSYWAQVPVWAARTEYFVSQAVLLALFAVVIQLRISGTVYLRIQVVALVLLLGALVSLSGILAFPGSSRVRYVAAISSAATPLMLLMIQLSE